MSVIRKLISVWMLTLAGSLLLPLMSVAAVSGTTDGTPYTTTTAPITIAEQTTAVETVGGGATSLQGMASGQSRLLSAFSRILVAPNKGTDLYRIVEKAELDDIARTGEFRFRPGSATPEPGLEGKFFYESLEDANTGASRIMRPSERAGTVRVTVPDEALKHTYPHVDGVERVQFIEMDDLRGLPIQGVD